MNVEKLKVIADGMGYKPVNHPSPSRQGDVQMYEKSEFHPMTQYNPLTNNDQMVEIMEKMKFTVSYDFVLRAWSARDHINAAGEGKTINAAVCAAAYEYFNV